ncbi:hypothetical protein SK128_007621, partial [Halocaridina rubra]
MKGSQHSTHSPGLVKHSARYTILVIDGELFAFHAFSGIGKAFYILLNSVTGGK